jgi:lipid-A-disaccharide synthase
MKYFIVVGEASGDLHASNLMKGIKCVDEKAQFKFFGGDLMALQGGTMVMHYKTMAFMGFWEVIKNLKQINRNIQLCKSEIKKYQPDVVILVDYPGFNLRIAKFAKNAGYKVVYYIAPKVWAWRESRVKLLQKYVDKLIAIFPFEIEYFKKHNIDVIYEGNPLVDALIEPTDKETNFFAKNNLDNRPIISILAGSRVQEINCNLPVMLSLVDKLSDYQFIIAGAPSLDFSVYEPYLKKTGAKIVFGKTQELLRNSTLAVVTSGTATLEAALLNIPEVVCYRGSTLSMLIASLVVKVKYISLVNLIMNKEVVKELIQYKLTEESLLREVESILPNKPNRERMLHEFSKLQSLLGEEGTSLRIAKKLNEVLTA